MKKSLVLVLSLFALSAQSFAGNDGAFLDKPYRNLQHPVVDDVRSLLPLGAKSRSNTVALIAKQTPVKSQENRGTCSIFSATALLESMLIINKIVPNNRVDLSEEWLQYLIAQNATDEGSESYLNYAAFRRYGFVREATMPYIGESWEDAREGLAQKRCGHLKGNRQKSCLVGHRDPALMNMDENELTNPNSTSYDLEFLKARTEALDNRGKFFKLGSFSRGLVRSTSEVKALLDRGIPLTLDIDFYYGAWNHREATELGIDRNMENWSKGLVGYPEDRSADLKYTAKDPAGHSIIVVGYDDDATITYTSNMLDGTKKTFTRKGVYYFKNSWGTDSFGANFTLNGKKFSGYGAITQDYAHEYGQFFQLEGLKGQAE